MIKPNIAQIYADYIDHKNKQNVDERYVGKESYFHASATATCLRKHWFRINKVEESDFTPMVNNRIMRLGTIVHNDYENALKFAFDNNNTNNTINSTIYSSNIESISTEGEIQIPEYNVRGFYDAVFKMKTGEVYLYDFKTIRSYPYKLKFGRNPQPSPNTLHEQQLATYGIAIEKEFGRLDGMFLYYYNKDSSVCKEKEVPMHYMDMARESWEEVQDNCLSNVPPPVELGMSPKLNWECKYCNYQTHCQDN
mgnify:CR=1 FL=1